MTNRRTRMKRRTADAAPAPGVDLRPAGRTDARTCARLASELGRELAAAAGDSDALDAITHRWLEAVEPRQLVAASIGACRILAAYLDTALDVTDRLGLATRQQIRDHAAARPEEAE